MQPQDAESGLVKRAWERTTKRRGTLTETPLEGQQVTTRFLDEHGGLQHAAGIVTRSAAGELVVESRENGAVKETRVPRDASVDITPRLIPPSAAEQRQALKLWQDADNGMNGPRGPLPEQPDDMVANLLLSAAGHAHNRGDTQKTANILKLVARDYRHSAEAAYARTALDALTQKNR
jgi:hypothetical protein